MQSSPSEGNRRCQQFKDYLNSEFNTDPNATMPKQGESLKIIYARGKRSTICYRFFSVLRKKNI